VSPGHHSKTYGPDLAWTIEIPRSAEEDLEKIDRLWQRRILQYMRSDVAALTNPRDRGKALTGELAGLWRFRVGNYRVICDIEDNIQMTPIVRVAPLSKAYT